MVLSETEAALRQSKDGCSRGAAFTETDNKSVTSKADMQAAVEMAFRLIFFYSGQVGANLSMANQRAPGRRYRTPIWAGIAVCPTHFAVSMLSQLAQMDLSMSHELYCVARTSVPRTQGSQME